MPQPALFINNEKYAGGTIAHLSNYVIQHNCFIRGSQVHNMLNNKYTRLVRKERLQAELSVEKYVGDLAPQERSQITATDIKVNRLWNKSFFYPHCFVCIILQSLLI